MAKPSIHADYRSVFSTASGRRVLKDLMLELGHGEKLYAKDDAGRIHNITKHDIAVFIRERIETKPKEDKP